MNRLLRSGSVVLSLVIGLVGMGGSFVIGQVVNPPSVSVLVAGNEIAPGSVLTEGMVKATNLQTSSRIIGNLIREDELDQFIGGRVVETIHALELISKSAISAEGNSAAANRLSLILTDPDLVAMVVPVSPQTSPDKIVVGDYVDVGFGTSSVTQQGELMSTAPTLSPFGNSTLGLDAFSPVRVDEATATPAVTTTPEPLLMMPVSKTLIRAARVITVNREQQTENTVGPNGETGTVVVDGKLLSLELAIPREAQEMLQFAIDNGSVRIALLSAQIDPTKDDQRQPTLGMTWNDLVSLMRMQRDAALAPGLPAEVWGPGAYAVEATLGANHLATLAAMTPTPTPTPTPSPEN